MKNKDRDDANFGGEVSVRYLEKNATELYKAFPLASKMDKTTFFKYMKKSGENKKPLRMTDLCDYCEKGKSIKNSLVQRLVV